MLKHGCKPEVSWYNADLDGAKGADQDKALY